MEQGLLELNTSLRSIAQVTLCDQLEAYMSRFALDNGDTAAVAGNGNAKEVAVPEGLKQMTSKKKDELDDKYGGSGGKKVLAQAHDDVT